MAKPKSGKPKLAACTPDDVIRAIRALSGFEIKIEGGKHIKVTHIATGKASVIPRHSVVNKHLLRDFVGDFLVRDVGILEVDIYINTFGVKSGSEVRILNSALKSCDNECMFDWISSLFVLAKHAILSVGMVIGLVSVPVPPAVQAPAEPTNVIVQDAQRASTTPIHKNEPAIVSKPNPSVNAEVPVAAISDSNKTKKHLLYQMASL